MDLRRAIFSGKNEVVAVEDEKCKCLFFVEASSALVVSYSFLSDENETILFL